MQPLKAVVDEGNDKQKLIEDGEISVVKGKLEFQLLFYELIISLFKFEVCVVGE